MHFRIGNYRYELTYNFRFEWLQPYNKHRYDYGVTYYRVSRFMFRIEDMVSELHTVCAVCESPEAREVFSGDEGWTVCEDCGSIEQGYKEVSLDWLEEKGLV